MSQVYLIVLIVTDMTKSAKTYTSEKVFCFGKSSHFLGFVGIFVGKCSISKANPRKTSRFAKLLVSKLAVNKIVE